MAIAGTENVIIDSNFLPIMLEHLSVLSVRSKLLMGVGVQLSVQLMLFQVSTLGFLRRKGFTKPNFLRVKVCETRNSSKVILYLQFLMGKCF
jgi:hypothetical protein